MEKEIKVLLIDDESDFTMPMAFWLKSRGYSVMSSSSGQEGVKMVQESSPDIVFLDINMPVMDGLQTLIKIRQSNTDIPVIIISAYVEDQQRMKEISKLGISGVFYKGKDFAEGLNLLESALRTHKQLKNK